MLFNLNPHPSGCFVSEVAPAAGGGGGESEGSLRGELEVLRARWGGAVQCKLDHPGLKAHTQFQSLSVKKGYNNSALSKLNPLLFLCFCLL